MQLPQRQCLSLEHNVPTLRPELDVQVRSPRPHLWSAAAASSATRAASASPCRGMSCRGSAAPRLRDAASPSSSLGTKVQTVGLIYDAMLQACLGHAYAYDWCDCPSHGQAAATCSGSLSSMLQLNTALMKASPPALHLLGAALAGALALPRRAPGSDSHAASSSGSLCSAAGRQSESPLSAPLSLRASRSGPRGPPPSVACRQVGTRSRAGAAGMLRGPEP